MPNIPERFKKAVHEQQIAFVQRTIFAQVLGNYTAAAALLWLFQGTYPLPQLLLWFAAVAVAVALRYLTLTVYWSRWHEARLLGMGWSAWFNLSSFLGGLVWGFAFFIFYAPDHLPETMLLVAVAVAFVAGSLGSNLAHFPAFAFFSTAVLGLMVARLFLAGGRIEILGGTLGILYYIVMTVAAREAQNLMHQAIVARLQIEEMNQELMKQRQQLISARDDAEKANMAKSKFLASASHDLRQPLHALRLFVDVLNERVRGAELKNIAGKIGSTADTLEELFSNLLELAKVDAGVIELEYKTIVLDELLYRVYQETEPLAAREGLSMRLHCFDGLVYTDPMVLTRILRNFVTNAIRYTTSGGVLLACRRRGEGMRISVYDTGQGIPPEQHARIFDEFHQLSNPERDGSKGLGLGLAIARRLAGLIEAPLDVRSEPGRGSCFSVTVPIADDETLPVTPVEALGSTTQALSGLRIVCVDDDSQVRDAMEELLANWGCDALVAESLDEVLHRYATADDPEPDLITADYRLRDGMVGPRVIAELRKYFAREIPAIIMTGDTSPQRLQDAAASGAAVLHKPIKAVRLRMMIEQMIVAANESG